MKKLSVLILAAVFILTVGTSFSALAASDEAVSAAETLHGYGLLNGSGTNADGSINYDLDRAPNRYEAVTMLVRLLGKEEEARSQKWETPFVDVVDWAAPYVGYAYNNGLTSGTSATTFGGDSLVNASQYLTFILRALGYNSETDFSWNKAWELTDKLGITNGGYNTSTEFTRGDVAIVSNSVLNVKLKDGEKTLIDVLDIARTNENNHVENVIIEELRIEPMHIRLGDKTYDCGGTEFYEYDNRLYSYFNPGSWIAPVVYAGKLINALELGAGLYRIDRSLNCVIIDTGTTRVSEFLQITRTEKNVDADVPVFAYTYNCNGKSISTPDFTESEKTIDGVHFIKMDDAYLVNVNDFLAYFGIDKTLSLETLNGEYCLVVE